MFDIKLRKLKYRYIESRLHFLSFLKPEWFTLLSFLTGIMALITIYFDHRPVAILLWILSRLFDGMDGMVARISGRQSDRGGYLDLVADFFLYAALPIVIALRLGGNKDFLATAILLGTFYINAAVWMCGSALMEKQGQKSPRGLTSLIMPSGLVEGFETMIFNCLMIVLPKYFVQISLVMAGLVFTGALLRFIQTMPILSGSRSEIEK